jgi:hypothetical protein
MRLVAARALTFLSFFFLLPAEDIPASVFASAFFSIFFCTCAAQRASAEWVPARREAWARV